MFLVIIRWSGLKMTASLLDSLLIVGKGGTRSIVLMGEFVLPVLGGMAGRYKQAVGKLWSG